MRKWIILLALLCAIDGVGTICRAQNRHDRRIYMWDVTLSMKGKGAKATEEGKKSIIGKIKGYNNNMMTNTDIAGPCAPQSSNEKSV